MENVLAAFRGQVRLDPEAAIFWTQGGLWTTGAVDAASNRAAHGLRAAGVRAGERVACLTKHTAECLVLTLAAMKIGAVCMPVNWRLSASELEYIVNDGRARVVLSDAPFLPVLRELEAPSVALRLATGSDYDGVPGFESWRMQWPAADVAREPRLDDTALQLYSSGTTGLPKGVELTHANLAQGMLHAVPPAIGYRGPPDVMLNVLPTYHIAGIGVALLTACRGGYSVLYPEFDPPTVLEAIDAHGITHAFLVPAMIQFMLQSPGLRDGRYDSLRAISYGASPISETVLVGAMQAFRCGFIQVYGLTETTGAITALPPEDHDPGGARRGLLRSAGKPIDGVELRVVDPVTGRDQPEGGVGEIWIRSAQNMKGYWANPAATRAAYARNAGGGTDWFRSGDAGYLREGYLYLHDRIKDMVISGGENIYPAEIENVLMQHPAIGDVAVIGVPDDTWGEAVKACVVLRPGTAATEAEIIAFARARIAHYKCPRSVDVLEAIPRNPTGKILKRVLREPYWQGRDRRVN